MDNEDSNSTPPSTGRRLTFTPSPSDNPFRMSTTPIQYTPTAFFSPPQFSYTGLLQSNFPYQEFPLPQPPINPTQPPINPTQLHFDDDEDDDDVVPETQPQQPKSQPGKTSKFRGRAKPNSWSNDEEVALIKSWIDISEDNNIGNSQKRGAFWTRVRNKFHDIMNKGEYRSVDQLNSKFKDLNNKISKFSGIYNNVVNNRRSGQSESDILQEALIRYRIENNGAPFGQEAAWNLLKMTPKWGPIDPMDLPPRHSRPSRPSKRSKSSPSNEHTLSSDAHGGGFNLNEDVGDDEVSPYEVEERQRPPGRYKGKQPSSSSNTGRSTEEVSRFLSQIDTFNTRGEKWFELEERKLKLREDKQKKRF